VCAGAAFMSLQEQEASWMRLAHTLPVHHYCRKMLGYLRAIEMGAEVIVDTDDDNIPKPGWAFPAFDGMFDRVQGAHGFVNVYELFTEQRIWPRGLPLDLITTRFSLDRHVTRGECRVGVWQGLADEDPDVDAIYRLTSDAPCTFRDRAPVVLAAGTFCPFNSQNTAIRRELFPLLYLPAYVTFRFTDILRSLVAQPIMGLAGYQLGFLGATVIQRRNPHDYMQDFVSEIPMYRECRRALEIAAGAVSPKRCVCENLLAAYASLHDAGIVEAREISALEAWIGDLHALGVPSAPCDAQA
jgi:hypothetical protein